MPPKKNKRAENMRQPQSGTQEGSQEVQDMPQKLNLRTKLDQMTHLVDFMCGRPDFAKGKMRGAQYKADRESLWTILTNELNEKGPPTRNWEGWQKVWRDLQGEVRRKLRVDQYELNETGGGRRQVRVTYTHQQQRVIELLQLRNITGTGGLTFTPEGPVRVPTPPSVEEIIFLNINTQSTSTITEATDQPSPTTDYADEDGDAGASSSSDTMGFSIPGPSSASAHASTSSTSRTSSSSRNSAPRKPKKKSLIDRLDARWDRMEEERRQRTELLQNSLKEFLEIQRERLEIEKRRELKE